MCELSWEELGAEMKGLSAVAIDHCRRISLLPTSAKDLLRARHQPARSTIYRALQSVKREDEIAVLKALHDAIHKADEAEVSQASNERTKAARDARQKGIALRRFASVTVTEDEGAPISLDVRVGVEAGRWKALQGDTAARRQHEIETWRRIRDKAERELSTLEGGEGR